MTLELLDVAYENKQIELGNVPESYKQVSPYGLVPAIVHAGKSVYESNIVNEYLNEAFEGDLMPSDPHGRAMVRVMMAYADSPWMVDFGSWFHSVTSRKEADARETEAARDRLLAHLRYLDGFIGKHGGPWIYGDSLTLADVAFATTVPLLEEHGLAVPDELHNLRAWLDAVKDLDSWQQVPTEHETEVETVKA